MVDHSTNHYARLVDLAMTILRAPAPDDPWVPVLDEVANTMRASVAMLLTLPATDARQSYLWTPDGSRPDLLESALSPRILPTHPHTRHYTTSGDHHPRTISDVASDHAWRRTEAYIHCRAAFDSTRQLAIPLPDNTTSAPQILSLGRPGIDFTNDERAYIQRLQPLLLALRAHLACLNQWHQTTAPSTSPTRRPVTDHEPLTPREAVVLQLLAHGLTAHAIARRLAVSPRTIHHHLEHLYRKLRASDRLTAVLQAQRLGLLPSKQQPPLSH